MDTATKTRAAAYSLALVLGLASALQLAGVADYDKASGMVDIHPFSVYVAVGVFTPVFSAALALVAVIKGWGGKP